MTHKEGFEDSASDDSSIQSVVLDDLIVAKNYREWICELIYPYLGDDPFELGSGNGSYAEEWLRQGVPKISLTELDEIRRLKLREKFQCMKNVEILNFSLSETTEKQWSSFVSVNVLEHIEDDVAAIAAATRIVKPGGAIVTYAPAFPLGMSDFDRRIGHFRRYTIESLSNVYSQAGCDLSEIRYVNSVGLLAWIISMRLFRMTPKKGRLLNLWDRTAIVTARRLENHWKVPFGQSILAVGHTRNPA